MSDKFDSSIRESPEMSGELYDDTFYCTCCHEDIPIDQRDNSVIVYREEAYCQKCAAYLEAQWEMMWEAQLEELKNGRRDED